MIKYLGLIIGLALVLTSFFFYGRKHETYELILVSGLIFSVIFYLAILFGKVKPKTKVIWTFVVILSAAIQWITEPYLIDYSYRFFIYQHKNELIEINSILLKQQGEISITKDTIYDKNGQLLNAEKANLKDLRKKLDVYMIDKSEGIIYYGLWGFLDIRLYVIYCTDKSKLENYNRKLKGAWYR
jgi:hypothetical protein